MNNDIVYITQYELTKVLAARAIQITLGDECEFYDPSLSKIKLAEKEFKAGKLNAYIERIHPNGKKELIHVSKMRYPE